jgi:GT2 family glycosyltransferase
MNNNLAHCLTGAAEGQAPALHQRSSGVRSVLVIAPLYRNAGLIEPLFQSLIQAAEDFTAIDGRLLLIVDSPNDVALRIALEKELPSLAKRVPVEVVWNKTNRGFLESINVGFHKAISERRDALILNSDVIVFPGSFREMRDVAYLDNMTGFVSPRSNNATICSLPFEESFRNQDVDAAYETFRYLSAFLPRVRYALTAVGYCMFVKWAVLKEFGVFDSIYGKGYSEENDLVMRANRCGYRAVLANHAFIYHVGGRSFALSDTSPSELDRINSSILISRYPHYPTILRKYLASSAFKAEQILVGLLPDSRGCLHVAFDWRNVGPYFNGTFEAAKQILRHASAAWKDRFAIDVIASESAAVFHGVDSLSNVRVVTPERAGTYAFMIRIGQPFDADAIDWMVNHAAMVVVYMLDTIALDCQHLDTQDLSDIWQHTFDAADVVIYPSKYTQMQFRARFHIPKETIEFFSLLSTTITEYAPVNVPVAPKYDILLIGNHFPHKYLDETIALIVERHPRATVAVLGSTSASGENIVKFGAGFLTESEVDLLYAAARVVLFPSHYEGFGFPVLHALAHKRPIVVRAMPLYDELSAALGGTCNLHQCQTTQEMVDLACSPNLIWSEEGSAPRADSGWGRVIKDLDKGLQRARGRLEFTRLVARFDSMNVRQEVEVPIALPLTATAPAEPTLPDWKHRLVRCINATTVLLTGMAGLVCIVATLLVAARGFTVPQAMPQVGIAGPFDGPAFISRFLLDSLADFSHRTGIVVTANYALHLVTVVSLAWLASEAGYRGRVRMSLAITLPLILMFGAQNYENLVTDFRAEIALGFTATTMAFALLVAYLKRRHTIMLVGVLLSAIVSVFEITSAFVAIVLLCIIGLYQISRILRFPLWKKIETDSSSAKWALVAIFAFPAVVTLTSTIGRYSFEFAPSDLSQYAVAGALAISSVVVLGLARLPIQRRYLSAALLGLCLAGAAFALAASQWNFLLTTEQATTGARPTMSTYRGAASLARGIAEAGAGKRTTSQVLINGTQARCNGHNFWTAAISCRN